MVRMVRRRKGGSRPCDRLSGPDAAPAGLLRRNGDVE